MQIVIDIPKYYYENNIKNDLPIYLPEDNIIAILPKGHGRLIDADEIQFENAEFDTYGDYCIAFDAIDQAETIIETDKEADE